MRYIIMRKNKQSGEKLYYSIFMGEPIWVNSIEKALHFRHNFIFVHIHKKLLSDVWNEEEITIKKVMPLKGHIKVHHKAKL